MKRLAVVAALFAASTVAAQGIATAFKTSEVVPGLHMIEGADGFGGGNIGLLIGDDFVVMIDDSMPPLSETLAGVVDGIAGRTPDFLINTHVHGDHAGGNAYFASEGTVVFAHENIRKRLLDNAEPAGGEAGLPVVTFGDGVTFHVNDVEARVIHIPNAHTDGDAVIWFPGLNVLHTGDIHFHDLFPYIDLDNGGTVDGYIAAQTKLVELVNDDTIIIPGHGVLSSKAELQKDLDVLIGAKERVAALVAADHDEEAVVAANPLADYAADYDWGFINAERMTRTLYRDLTQGK